MNLQDEIRNLTMSFFETIGSDIVLNNKIYNIAVIKKYQNYFRKKEIAITFDRDVASDNDCELVIPGSRVLSVIIAICSNKGPISTKRSQINSNGKIIVRYHFFVNFSGITNVSQIMYVDVNLDTCKLEDDLGILKNHVFSLHENMNAENVTASYLLAENAIKIKSDSLMTEFLSDANKEFQEDLELFMTKYDSQIRELDNKINQRGESIHSQNFRFDTIEKIKELESEKMRLNEAMQKKHKISLEYNLVACELICS